jgi:hypothetical protein
VKQYVERQGQVLLHQRLLGGDEDLVGDFDHLDLDAERVAEVTGEAFGYGDDVARGGQFEGTSFRPSGRGEKTPGLIGIVRVRLQTVRSSARIRRGQSGDGVGVNVEDLVDHAVAVHGKVERLADPHVVHEAGVAVDQARYDAQGVDGDEVGVLGVYDLPGILGRDLANNVDLPFSVSDLLQRLRRVDVVHIDDLLQARATLPVLVVGVGFENDAVRAREVGEEPGRRAPGS